MIDISDYTKALQTVLLADEDLSQYPVERSQRINYDPGRCPWIGVYPDQVNTSPLALAVTGNNRWRSTFSLQVIVQTSSFIDDGASASDELEDIVQSVESAVDADLTLGLAGARCVGFDREYRYVEFDDDGQGTVFMPQCIIKLNMEVRS